MSVSSGANVFRWSALGVGILYGFYHQRSITSRDQSNAYNREYQQKSNLIDQAKAAYVKKSMPAEQKTAGGGIITDPEDPKFDLEAVLTTAQAEQK